MDKLDGRYRRPINAAHTATPYGCSSCSMLSLAFNQRLTMLFHASLRIWRYDGICLTDIMYAVMRASSTHFISVVEEAKCSPRALITLLGRTQVRFWGALLINLSWMRCFCDSYVKCTDCYDRACSPRESLLRHFTVHCLIFLPSLRLTDYNYYCLPRMSLLDCACLLILFRLLNFAEVKIPYITQTFR